MGSVSINSVTYQIYGTDTGAGSFDAYWGAGLGDSYNAWLAASAVKRDQALVAATRLLDRQLWEGTPVGVPVIDSVLQWPRNGAIDQDGNVVSNASVPDAIVKGCYELAAALLADSSLQSNALSGSNVKSVKAGPVQVDFFTSTLGITGSLPTQVQVLVGQFLRGSSGTPSSVSYGTDATQTSAQSQFDNDDSYNVIIPNS